MTLEPEVQIALIAALLILILTWVFRNRVAEVVFGPAKVTLFRPEEQQAIAEKGKELGEKEAPSTPPIPPLKWQKVATLLWLGNDLMWIADMIYRGATPERVLQGVTHAKQYLADLGFTDSSTPLRHLAVATDVLQSLTGIDTSAPRARALLKQHYTTVVQEVQAVKWFISALAAQQEQGFKKLRAI